MDLKQKFRNLMNARIKVGNKYPNWFKAIKLEKRRSWIISKLIQKCLTLQNKIIIKIVNIWLMIILYRMFLQTILFQTINLQITTSNSVNRANRHHSSNLRISWFHQFQIWTFQWHRLSTTWKRRIIWRHKTSNLRV